MQGVDTNDTCAEQPRQHISLLNSSAARSRLVAKVVVCAFFDEFLGIPWNYALSNFESEGPPVFRLRNDRLHSPMPADDTKRLVPDPGSPRV